MPQARFTFPRGFLWGSATASHQVEGGNTNNSWSRWEETPGKIIEGQRSGLACDWWGGRWKEDLKRALDSGQNAHRLSIEWSRIQPTADTWDDKALEKYVEIVRWMADHKMTPMVTLHHFTDPLWLVDRGGWESEETPALFARYVRRVVTALKEYVSLWITINEPNVFIMTGWVDGGFPPGKRDLKLAASVTVNVLRGHAAAYRVLHELQPEAQVGVATNYRSLVPAHSWNPFDKFPVRVQDQLFNRAFNDALATGKLNLVFKKITLPEVAGTQDFIGLNYYTRDFVAFDITRAAEIFGKRYFAKDALISPTGFIANVPAGLWDGFKWAHKFDLPIIVTENGVEDHLDTLRPRYLVEHLHQVWRAANFNWRVKGYFHWSLVDNFEWERGWTQRFGLWGLDEVTQERTRRKSVDVYESICKENAIDSEMVRKMVPEIFDTLFPSQ